MNPTHQPATPFERLREFLALKLSAAEASLRARTQMEQSWREGTNAEWEAAAKMHPDTAKEPPMSKADRLKESATQGRIAEKCRAEVEMFKATAALLNSHAALVDRLEIETERGRQWCSDFIEAKRVVRMLRAVIESRFQHEELSSIDRTALELASKIVDQTATTEEKPRK